MSQQVEPTRTISEFEGRRGCSYTRSRPYKGCTANAKYLMKVETQGTKTRRPWTVRYYYCEQHVPWEKVRPSGAQQPDIPADSISAQETADIIGISIMTLHQWRGRGKGPKSTKVRGRCWYNRQEVENWAEAWRTVNRLHGEGRVARTPLSSQDSHNPPTPSPYSR